MIFPFFNLLQEFAVPTLALPAIRLALGLVTELRIDVNHTPDEVESELDAIRNRMSRSSDRLYGLPEVRTDIPGWCCATARRMASTTSTWWICGATGWRATRCSTG